MNAKSSTAIFRIILRPSIAAQPSFSTIQCRTLFLYHAAHAITTLGSHDIKNWVPYKFPDAKEVKLNLWSHKGDGGSGELSLHSALETIIPKPGNPGYLCNILSGQVTTKHEFKSPDPMILPPEGHATKTYAIRPLPTAQCQLPKKIPRSRGCYRRFFFTPESANTLYFEMCMAKMYRFLERDMPIEVSITARSWAGLELMVKDNPQVHPTAILAAMPHKSGIIIQPQTDGKGKINWVMLGPKKGKDGELHKPYSQTKKFYDFRSKVLDDLKKSAEMGSRPDVVDPKVAAMSNIAVARRLKRIEYNRAQEAKERENK